MDTKLKNYKYSIATKMICLLLSVLCIIGSAACAIVAIGDVMFYGSWDCINNKNTKLEETAAYADYTYASLLNMCTVANSTDAEMIRAAAEKKRGEVVGQQVENFVVEKAEIIYDELMWCLENTVPDSNEYKKIVSVLDNNQGEQLLQYDDMVRSEAFDEYFHYVMSFDLITGRSVGVESQLPLSLDLDDVKRQFGEAFDSLINEITAEGDSIYSMNVLESSKNLFYYIANGDKVITNMKDSEAELKAIDEHKVYLKFENGKVVSQSGLAACMGNATDNFFRNVRDSGALLSDVSNKVTISYYIADEVVSGDGYSDMCRGYAISQRISLTTLLVLTLVLFIAALVLLISMLCLCGHKNGVEGICLAPIDKLPTDIHTVLSFAVSGGLMVLAVLLGVNLYMGLDLYDAYMWYARTQLQYSTLPLTGAALLCGVAWLFISEWLASTVRISKSEQSYFGRFAIFMFLKWIILLVIRVIKAFIGLFSYSPGQFKKRLFFGITAYFIADCILLAFCVGMPNPIDIVLFIAINVYTLNRTQRYVKQLDEIITASAQRRAPNLRRDSLPKSLRTLADSMSVTRDELDKAVASAVKDERMRTELITNVSHDLKTPLTSIISYVDLLRRCDIQDENAQSYLKILDEKSSRLKRLIEDLVEASKASSGAVRLNKTQLNFNELAYQAAGEMSEDFDNAGLEMVLDSQGEPPIIFADGQKTYRIIENLFNNARKYSADNSRVYVRLSKRGGFGVMEVKNMSRQALNISPEELTERFVRGDSSRTDGGSGLGLAIASDLCTLQNGHLKITIDGDLFKAEVYLPLFVNNEPVSNRNGQANGNANTIYNAQPNVNPSINQNVQMNVNPNGQSGNYPDVNQGENR